MRSALVLSFALFVLVIAGCAAGGREAGPAGTATTAADVGTTTQTTLNPLAAASPTTDPQAASPTTSPAATNASSAHTLGQAIFADVCAVCHGEDGSGRIGLDLTISSLPLDDITAVIVTGRQGTQMAGFGAVLTDAQIDAVAGYVATLRPRS